MAEKMTILVGTVGQGVMRSADGGERWARLGIERGLHSDAIVRTLVLHPRNPATVFAGTDRGLLRSDDAGGSFRQVGSELAGYCVWALAIDPQESEVMFAGTGTPTPARLFRSTDSGDSWLELTMEAADECPAVGVPRVTAIAIDPDDRASVWVGIEVDGVRHSADRGETWSSVGNDAIPNPDVHSVGVTAGPAKKVFVLVNNEVYTSSDDGGSWNPLGIAEKFPMGYPRALRLHPNDPNLAYVTLGDWTPGTTGAVMRTSDGGDSWESLPLPVQPNSAMWYVSIQPFDPQVMFAGSRYGYLYRSDDAGASWRKLTREFSEISSIQWLPA